MCTKKPVAVLILLCICMMAFTHCTVTKQDLKTVNYNKEAWKEFKKGNYRNAIATCQASLAYNPKNDWAYASMGDTYYLLDKFDSALIEYNAYLALKPENAGARFRRAGVLDELKQYEEAISDYDYTIKKNYRKACSYNNRGIAKDKLKRYDEALSDYDSSIKTGWYYHRSVYLNKAGVYLKKNEIDLAIKEVDKSIKQDSLQLCFPAHYSNVKEEKLIADKDKLLTDTLFLKEMRRFNDAYTYKGYIYTLFGRYNEALKYLNHESILPIPQYCKPLGKGKIAFNTMYYNDAKRYFDSAIAINPKINEAYLSRGILYQRLGKNDAAMADYNLAISIDSTEATPFQLRGDLEIYLGAYQTAIADFNKAISINDENEIAKAYNSRGYAYFLNKQYQAAINDYDTAKMTAKSWYQPYYEYRKEALAALNNNGNNFCTLVAWQAPIGNINLLDSARFHIPSNERLDINFKIVTNQSLDKSKIFTMMDGQSISNGSNGTFKIISEDAAIGKFEYEYALKINPLKGKHLLGLEYEGKSSQKMVLIVE